MAAEEEIFETEFPPSWHDLDCELGPILDQGKDNCCWAVSTANSFDIMDNSKGMPITFRHSSQEIVNAFSLNRDISSGYFPECALEFVIRRGIPTVAQCPYRGLLQKTDPTIHHRCKVRDFPIKYYKHYNIFSPEWEQESFWKNDVLTWLCQQPLIMGFKVGLAFTCGDMKKEIYDPYEHEPCFSRPHEKFAVDMMELGGRFGFNSDDEDICDEDSGMNIDDVEYVADNEDENEMIIDDVMNTNDGNVMDIVDDNVANITNEGCVFCASSKEKADGSFCAEHFWNESNSIYYHAMLVTGYDIRDNPFWKAKNSFGYDWADNGCCRVAMNLEKNSIVSIYVPIAK